MKRLPLVLLITTFVYEVAIFYVSVQPYKHVPVFVENQDKVAHFAVYALLGLLLALASATGGRGYTYAGGLLAGLFIAVLSEYVQQWVPHRTPSFYDGLANVLGLLIVISVYEAAHLWKRGGVLYAETMPPGAMEGSEDEGGVAAENK